MEAVSLFVCRLMCVLGYWILVGEWEEGEGFMYWGAERVVGLMEGGRGGQGWSGLVLFFC